MLLTPKRSVLSIAAVALLSAACTKKNVAATPPPPPATTAVARPAPPKPAPPQTIASVQPSTNVAPGPRYPDKATRARIDELLAKIEDAYFDYNKASLRPDAENALRADSTELRDILKDYPDYKLTIQGFCDERGSAEYNVALGDRRAESAKGYLVQIGIPAAQMSVVSFGKERQVCQEHDEACWQKNRRIHIVAMAQKP